MELVAPLSSFRPQRVEFSFCAHARGFVHNFGRDFHLFALWEKSSPHWDQIAADIRENFVVHSVHEIHWSPEHVDDNFLRLYGMSRQPTAVGPSSGKRGKMVGTGPFLLLVVEDLAPLYIYHRTFSQKVELVNRKIVAAKARYRELAEGGLNVHSSNSIVEFFRDCTLFLGGNYVSSLLVSNASVPDDHGIKRLDRDLSGARGWRSMTELFENLRYCSDYVVLRNFSTLPEKFEEDDGDLDVLCTSAQDFIAVSGGFVTHDDGAKFSCNLAVGEGVVPVDVRFVGDGYYDPAWERAIIDHAVLHSGIVSVPQPDDHFFSLLYHAKLHKSTVKTKYIKVLELLASDIGLHVSESGRIDGDAAALQIISGYLFEKRYERSLPLDIAVGRNLEFAKQLDSTGLLWNRRAALTPIWLRSILAGLPFVWRIRGRGFDLVEKCFRYIRSRHFAR